jgi:hypothetical protein
MTEPTTLYRFGMSLLGSDDGDISHRDLLELGDIVISTNRQFGTAQESLVEFIRSGQARGHDLSRISLANVDLRGADLRDTNLQFARLTDVDLSGAHLGRADLSHAVLDGSSFLDANFTGANLVGARMRGARLSSATSAFSNFATSVNDSAVVNSVTWSTNTEWPHGLRRLMQDYSDETDGTTCRIQPDAYVSIQPSSLDIETLRNLLTPLEIIVMRTEDGEIVEKLTLLRYGGHFRSNSETAFAVKDVRGKFRVRSARTLGLTDDSPYECYLAVGSWSFALVDA